MGRVSVLDCTLRDGGYCNQWRFSFNSIKKITDGLVEAGIDIIECGFLTQKVEYDCDVTKFTQIDQISKIIPSSRQGKLFVAMMNYGEYDVDSLPEYDGTSIDGIRVAFHKKNRIEALEVCRAIKAKGYKVFVQAMVSLSYSDEEFLELIRLVNSIVPYAFYIVDSFGMIKRKDLNRLFYVVEHNLKSDILIGFHSHNNMQLAYSNAQNMVDTQTNRSLIIDSSVYGMGRGAGNLNTELFVEYLNENEGTRYNLKPLLTIIDQILNGFHQENYWGYSLPNYLSARYWTHPNYAGYLDDKKTLTVEAMSEIFEMMDEDKRIEFDSNYIEELYLRYMATGAVQDEHRSELRSRLEEKKVLLIAPGCSSIKYSDRISKFASNADVVTIGINGDYQFVETDFIFMSNMRRFREMDKSLRNKCIVTSNIPTDGIYLQTRYRDLVNDIESVKDNSGMMAIKLLIDFNVQQVYLAGFDGYSHDNHENYANTHVAYYTKNAVLDAMNAGMAEMIKRFSKQIEIHFITPSRFELTVQN